MTRVAPWSLLAVAALLTACGDGGDPAGDPGAGQIPQLPSTSAQGGPPPVTHPNLTGVKLRLVNLYLPPDGQPDSVDVLPGIAIGDQSQVEPLDTLKTGEVTEYFEPPGNADGTSAVMAFFPEGMRAPDDLLINFDQTMKPGDQWTVALVRGAERSDGKPSFGFSTIEDDPQRQDADNAGLSLPAPAAGKGQIVGYAGGLLELMEAEDNSFKFGLPGKGCLKAPDEGLDLNVGGTSWVPFDVDPGTVELAAYDAVDIECSGEPEVGPVDVQVTAGKRTHVLVWSSTDDPADRELMVLPTQ